LKLKLRKFNTVTNLASLLETSKMDATKMNREAAAKAREDYEKTLNPGEDDVVKLAVAHKEIAYEAFKNYIEGGKRSTTTSAAY
jgi:hypothetical protein